MLGELEADVMWVQGQRHMRGACVESADRSSVQPSNASKQVTKMCRTTSYSHALFADSTWW